MNTETQGERKDSEGKEARGFQFKVTNHRQINAGWGGKRKHGDLSMLFFIPLIKREVSHREQWSHQSLHLCTTRLQTQATRAKRSGHCEKAKHTHAHKHTDTGKKGGADIQSEENKMG